MKFSMEVGGNIEKFILEYQCNEWLGSMVIKVDDQEVKRQHRWFSLPARQSLDLALGKQEQVNVRIEKEQRFPFGQRNRVFVNDRLVKLFEGV